MRLAEKRQHRLGLVVVGGVFGLAAMVGFVVIMMMAEAGPF